MRSVLLSNDEQEDSEKEEGLEPTFSSRNPSPRSMERCKDENAEKIMEMNDGDLHEDG